MLLHEGYLQKLLASVMSRCPNVCIYSRLGNIRGLSGKYPVVLNI